MPGLANNRSQSRSNSSCLAPRPGGLRNRALPAGQGASTNSGSPPDSSSARRPESTEAGFFLRVQSIIAALLALTPLLIVPPYFFHYDITPKVAVALMGTAIALVLFLCDSPFAGARGLWAHPAGRRFCLLAAAHLIS